MRGKFFTVAVVFISNIMVSFSPKPDSTSAKIFCATQVVQADNLNTDATITNIEIRSYWSVPPPSPWVYSPDILLFGSADLSASHSCNTRLVRVWIDGPFSTVSLMQHGTNSVYDQLSYDPMGTGLYVMELTSCAVTYDIVVQ